MCLCVVLCHQNQGLHLVDRKKVQKKKMKKFSRMPKSESGGLGGASGSSSSSGVSSYFGKVFAVGRYQVTVEELIAEGKFSCIFLT